MTKKILGLMMTLAILLSVSAAYAEQPSPAMPAVIQGAVVASQDEKAETNANASEIVVTLQQITEETEQQSIEIEEAIEQKTVSEFFDQEVVEQIAEIAPEVKMDENVAVVEFWEINAEGTIEAESVEELEISFQFVTDYDEEKASVVVIGIVDETGAVTWIPVDSKVVDGKLVVKIEKELIASIASSANSFFVLLQQS